MGNLLLSIAGLFARLLPESLKRALYRSRWMSRIIRQALNRAAPTGLTEVQVAAGRLRGTKLLLNMQVEKDYWLGTYEQELQSVVYELAKPGMIAYDIGANIGFVALLLARMVGSSGRVFAFEALPANLERLQTNIKLNDMESLVRVVPVAVAECSGRARFVVGPSNGMGKVAGSAGRATLEDSRSIEVEAISLDAFVYEMGNPPPQLIKMDIEGGEVLALPGMRRLLAEARPLILLELHGIETAQVAFEVLVESGYRICRMVAGYPEVRSTQELNWKEYLMAKPTG